jgi:hypothetical protein
MKKYTKDALVEQIRKSIQSLGYVPSLPEYNKLRLKPTEQTIRRHGLTWSEAMNLAGYTTRKVDFLSKEEMLEQLKKYISIHGPVISYQDYLRDYQRYDLPSPSTLIRQFGSFKKAIEEAGGSTPYRMIEYTKEDLIFFLQEYYRKYKVAPTMPEWEVYSEKNNLPGKSAFQNIFKRWNLALEAAGLVPNLRRTPKWDREKILSALRENFSTMPGRREYEKLSKGNKDIPSSTTVVRFFGSLANAFMQAFAKDSQ